MLLFLPVPGQPLQARYYGPYEIKSKINDLNYIVETPGRRKNRRLCHVNMLKAYVDMIENVQIKPIASVVNYVETNDFDESGVENHVRLKNSEILLNLSQKLYHLENVQQQDMSNLIGEYCDLFPDVPNKTSVAFHDVDEGECNPVKQHPYRVNPVKLEHMRNELDYMLQNGIIEKSSSAWSSLCILVPKPDGSYRFCTDFRKVNALTKSDSYPIPRIDSVIDKVGNAKFVSKFDLLKGYWQVPLTERANEISAFVTPDGLFQYRVMPFGMNNAPATFQRMINSVICDLDFCEAYINDVIIVSESWDQHVKHVKLFFDKMLDANLTIDLAKSEFGKATVEYLGHVVGQGQVKPITAKVDVILNFPVPKCKKDIMRFLGMVGFYRKFCKNFSTIANPLTDMLHKKSSFVWSDACQRSFESLKSILVNSPILITPDFSKQFRLYVDASDVAAGAVLMQEIDFVDHPISFYSKKFTKMSEKLFQNRERMLSSPVSTAVS